MQINTTDIMTNEDGSVYHLNLLPQEIATTVILVGDPQRVPLVSRHFDQIECQKQKREFVTHTGRIGKLKISVISTGIGVGNIDIVLNELDILTNIDITTHTIKKAIKPLRIIRLGTCGCLAENINVDELIVSSFALSFDGLLHFYQMNLNPNEKYLLQEVHKYFSSLPVVRNACVAEGSKSLQKLFAPISTSGITLTCPGFYGPQGRQLRISLMKENLLNLAEQFHYNNQRITNFEMETAAIYGLGRLLNYECCSISTVIANRATQQISKDGKKAIERMIRLALERLSSGS